MVQFHIELFAGIVMLIMLCGFIIMISRLIGTGFEKKLWYFIMEFIHDVQIVMQIGQEETASEDRQSISWETIRLTFAMPLLLLICFPAMYEIAIKIFGTKANDAISPFLLGIVLLGPLILLVLGVFAHVEKTSDESFG